MYLGSCWWPCLLLWDEEGGATCLQKERSKAEPLRDAEKTDGGRGLPGFAIAFSFLLFEFLSLLPFLVCVCVGGGVREILLSP